MNAVNELFQDGPLNVTALLGLAEEYPKHEMQRVDQEMALLCSDIEKLTSPERLDQGGSGYGLCLAETSDMENQIIQVASHFSPVIKINIDDLIRFLPESPGVSKKIEKLSEQLSDRRNDLLIVIGGVHDSKIFTKLDTNMLPHVISEESITQNAEVIPLIKNLFEAINQAMVKKRGDLPQLIHTFRRVLATAIYRSSTQWEWIAKNTKGPPILVSAPSYFHHGMLHAGDERRNDYDGRSNFKWPDTEALYGTESMQEIDIDGFRREISELVEKLTHS